MKIGQVRAGMVFTIKTMAEKILKPNGKAAIVGISVVSLSLPTEGTMYF